MSLGIVVTTAIVLGLKPSLGVLVFVVFCIGSFLPRRPWSWVVGVAAIGLGMTWPCSLPFAAVLLVFWLRSGTREFFQWSIRPETVQRVRRFPWGWASLAAGTVAAVTLAVVCNHPRLIEIRDFQERDMLLRWWAAGFLTALVGWVMGLVGVILGRLRGWSCWVGWGLNTLVGIMAVVYPALRLLFLVWNRLASS